jgi:hypothetical protein
MKYHVITSGVASEYVLKDLCRFLSNEGWGILEFDFATFTGDPYRELNNYQGNNIVYITSAHINITRRSSYVSAPFLLKSYPNYLSPLEIMSILKPSVSIYIPHDLLSPFGETSINDFNYLSLFDFVLSPYPALPLQLTVGEKTKVIESGWIKFASPASTFFKKNKINIAILPSFIESLISKFGAHGTAEYFLPLLNEGVRIKFPHWKDVHLVEDVLGKFFPACLIKSTTNSTELIQWADIVIANGASSIHAEANYLGKPSICLLDSIGSSMEEQQHRLRKLPMVYFHDYRFRDKITIELFEELKETVRQPSKQPFRYEVVSQILRNAQ